MRNSSHQAAENPPPEAAGLFKTFAASVLVLIAGAAFILQATDGARAWTTESLRRSEVSRVPQPLPDLALRDSAGRDTRLHPVLAAGNKVWIVDFVYTRCQTVCSALGAGYQQLQRQLIDRGLQDRVGLLSISFDPRNDDPAALRAYTARMGVDPVVWQVLTLASPTDRRALLDAFGIMVIPAPLGEYEHNAALHIVDAQARLVQIVDYAALPAALDAALHWQP